MGGVWQAGQYCYHRQAPGRGKQPLPVGDNRCDTHQYRGVRAVLSVRGVKPVLSIRGVRPVLSVRGVRPVLSVRGVRPVLSVRGVRPVLSIQGGQGLSPLLHQLLPPPLSTSAAPATATPHTPLSRQMLASFACPPP